VDESLINIGQKSNGGNATNGATDTTVLQNAHELSNNGERDAMATTL